MCKNTYEIGEIKISIEDSLVWLYDATPNYKKSFIQLATEGHGIRWPFNRAIPCFVAQGGCSNTP